MSLCKRILSVDQASRCGRDRIVLRHPDSESPPQHAGMR